jgi:pyrimidine oxygenase
MAKWSGYGGETHFWDHSIESCTVIAALAEVKTQLRLVASISPILIHPTIVAKMMATLDDISGGRIALNIVSSDTEYNRMGLYPEDFYSYRHKYIDEWLRVVRLLWTGEPVNFEGEYFTLTGYASKPRPVQQPGPPIVYATSSEAGYGFVAEQCDEAFVGYGDGTEMNARSKLLKEMAGERGRTIKTQTLVTPIVGDTDADAQRIMEGFREGADLEVIARVYDRGASPADLRARGQELLDQGYPQTLTYFGGPLIGGPERVADCIEDLVVNGDFDGMLCTFPDFIEGLKRFDGLVMPLLQQRGLRI